MPTATIIYRTADGRSFDSEEAAEQHESLIAQVDNALKPLGSVPDAVSDGKGWVQHSKASYERAHTALCRLAAPTFKGGWPKLYDACLNDPLSVHPMSVAGRILDDADTPVTRGWGRLQRIDSAYREHQQPYYALRGPDKGQVCVEDRR